MAIHYKISKKRVKDAMNGEVKVRPDVPVMTPNPNTAVARLPVEFAKAREDKQ